MSEQPIYLTKEGLENLKAELEELIDVKRPEIALKIKEGRELGDLSENAVYESAKEEQAFIEGRIAELQEIIKNAVVSKNTEKDKVYVGAKVTVHIEGSEETFHIVGGPEADPLNGKISHESPIGQALLDKKVGDHIDVEAPVGKLTYTILKVE